MSAPASSSKDALALYEITGLLHDLGKLSTRFFIKPPPYDYELLADVASIFKNLADGAIIPEPLKKPIKRANSETRKAPFKDRNDMTGIFNSILLDGGDGHEYNLAEVLLIARPGSLYTDWQPLVGKPMNPALLVGSVHGILHYEKQDKDASGAPCAYQSTPFGYEREITLGEPGAVDSALAELPLNDLLTLTEGTPLAYGAPERRQAWLDQMRRQMSHGVADTRRPINDLSLWEWSWVVAQMAKAGGVLLAEKSWPSPPTEWNQLLSWKTVGVHLDQMAIYQRVEKISDLLGLQDVLRSAYQATQDWFETELGWGSLYYQDELGAYYLLPAMDLPGNWQSAIRQSFPKDFQPIIIEGEASFGDELDPDINPGNLDAIQRLLDQPRRRAIEALKHPEHSGQNTIDLREAWNGSTEREICSACGLRPVGSSLPDDKPIEGWATEQKARERKVCRVCLSRRQRRSKQWATEQTDRTIWTDEVADDHGLLAMIVGEFSLDEWLNGRMFQTLRLGMDIDINTHQEIHDVKKPSPVRLFSVWQTARRFWDEVLDELIPGVTGKRSLRLALFPDAHSLDGIEGKLGDYHTYELKLKTLNLAVVWDPANKCFITNENLGYFCRRLGSPWDELARLWRKQEEIAYSPIIVTAEDCNGTGNDQAGDPDLQSRLLTIEMRLQCSLLGNVQVLEPSGYSQESAPLGSVKIKRVEKRAPYQPSIPLLQEPAKMLALIPGEAALRLGQAIKQKYEAEFGKVRDRLPLNLGIVFFPRRTPIRAVLEAGHRMFALSNDWQCWELDRSTHEERSARLDFCNGLAWRIPVQMIDGAEDQWYPYLFKSYPAKNRDLTAISRHVLKIAQEHQSTIWVMPSYFDYEFLDASGRRFEIAYNHAGRRFTRPTRPYYLEELDQLDQLWGQLKQLERSQIEAILGAIEETRTQWDANPNDTDFMQFVADTLAGANWKQHPWKGWSEEDRKNMIEAAKTGQLNDVAELFMHILKEKTTQE